MKHRILSTILAGIMLCSATVTAFATDSDDRVNNFKTALGNFGFQTVMANITIASHDIPNIVDACNNAATAITEFADAATKLQEEDYAKLTAEDPEKYPEGQFAQYGAIGAALPPLAAKYTRYAEYLKVADNAQKVKDFGDAFEALYPYDKITSADGDKIAALNAKYNDVKATDDGNSKVVDLYDAVNFVYSNYLLKDKDGNPTNTFGDLIKPMVDCTKSETIKDYTIKSDAYAAKSAAFDNACAVHDNAAIVTAANELKPALLAFAESMGKLTTDDVTYYTTLDPTNIFGLMPPAMLSGSFSSAASKFDTIAAVMGDEAKAKVVDDFAEEFKLFLPISALSESDADSVAALKAKYEALDADTKVVLDSVYKDFLVNEDDPETPYAGVAAVFDAMAIKVAGGTGEEGGDQTGDQTGTDTTVGATTTTTGTNTNTTTTESPKTGDTSASPILVLSIMLVSLAGVAISVKRKALN